jgi:hypothetical protein
MTTRGSLGKVCKEIISTPWLETGKLRSIAGHFKQNYTIKLKWTTVTNMYVW